MGASTGGGQKASDPLELELQVVVDHLMWVLEAGLASSMRIVLSLKS